MALSDIYELTLAQLYGAGGERLLTKWYYQKAGSGESASDLAEHFFGTGSMLARLNAFQSTKIVNETVRVINLGDLADFADVTLTGGGALATDAAPAFCAVGFTLKLDTRAVRPGSKRIPGVSEADQADGIIVNAGVITDINLAAVQMAEDIAGDSAELYRPVVLKRVHIVEAGPPARDFYRLPETDEELVAARVIVALVNMKVTHQVSRGNGR